MKNYHIMDYVGDPAIITKTIKTATEKPETKQGQAALRMIEKRHFKKFGNQFYLNWLYNRD